MYRYTELMQKYNYVELVQKLRNPEVFDTMDEDLLHKCIVYKSFFSSNKYSLQLENDLRKMFNLSKKINNNCGDGTSVFGKKIEIKISLGNTSGIFNFLQIRPSHDIDHYLFMIYDLNHGDEGKIQFFLLSSRQVDALIPKYASYTHGSVKNIGKITRNFNKMLEYTLRPCNNTKNKKGHELWKKFLMYEKTEQEIYIVLNT
jgi:hypothetical protein